MTVSVFIMPIIDDKRLLKLPVFTRSGAHLGRLAGFEYETDGQMIVRYRVRPKGIAKRLVGGPLVVGREQVLSVTEERMTVEDGVEKEMELAKAKALGLVTETSA